MATIKSLSDLKVWNKARLVSETIFDLYMRDPFARDFILRDQINRSSGSVMDNIAEGYGRDGNREFIQYLSFSRGSAFEVLSQLTRAHYRKYISSEEFTTTSDNVNEVIRMAGSLMDYLRDCELKGRKFKRDKA